MHKIEFPTSLPGFENRTRFDLVERPGLAPLVFLESLDAPDLCFPAAPVSAIDPQYRLEMCSEDLQQLGFETGRQPRIGDEVLCLAILTAPENGPLTANLLAPIVIDPKTRRAVQAVRADSVYSHRHPLGETPCS